MTMVQADNSSGNYFMGRPNGWETMQDSVFVVAMLIQPGTVTAASGSNTRSFNAPAGISSCTLDMGLGKQQFWLTRNGQTVLSAVSLKDISNVCPCGLYNFNAYVGTVPDAPPDPLQHDGRASLTAGLHVSTCSGDPVPAHHNDPANQYSSGRRQPADDKTFLYHHPRFNNGNIKQHFHQHADHVQFNHILGNLLQHHGHQHHICASHGDSVRRRYRPGESRRPLQFLLQLRLLPTRSLHMHRPWRPDSAPTREQCSRPSSARRG